MFHAFFTIANTEIILIVGCELEHLYSWTWRRPLQAPSHFKKTSSHECVMILSSVRGVPNSNPTNKERVYLDKYFTEFDPNDRCTFEIILAASQINSYSGRSGQLKPPPRKLLLQEEFSISQDLVAGRADLDTVDTLVRHPLLIRIVPVGHSIFVERDVDLGLGTRSKVSNLGEALELARRVKSFGVTGKGDVDLDDLRTDKGAGVGDRQRQGES